MKLLLDTCTFIWLVQEPKRLSANVKQALDDEHHSLYLSHASVWEISLKHLAGKLTLPAPPREWISEQLTVRGVGDWGIDMESLYQSGELPLFHHDPFDRLLIAQTKVHGFHLVSPDESFPPYGIETIW